MRHLPPHQRAGENNSKKILQPTPRGMDFSVQTPLTTGRFVLLAHRSLSCLYVFLCINGVSDVHHFIQCADRSVLGGRICCGLCVLWLECPTSFLKRDAHCSVFVPVLILIAHVFAQRRSAACSGTGFSPQNASRHRQPYGNINPQ